MERSSTSLRSRRTKYASAFGPPVKARPFAALAKKYFAEFNGIMVHADNIATAFGGLKTLLQVAVFIDAFPEDKAKVNESVDGRCWLDKRFSDMEAPTHAECKPFDDEVRSIS